jgi:hypothetical protein
MSLQEFARQLRESGEIRIRTTAEPADAETRGAQEILRAIEGEARLRGPHGPPEYEQEAATWGLTMLYRACRFLVYRHFDEKTVREAMGRKWRENKGHREIYSADLALSHLPEVYELAGGLATADPLVECLRELALEWPLSSVGIALPREARVEEFFDHPSLRAIYLDRIVRRRDASRLKEARVKEALAATLGIYAKELSGGLVGGEEG